MGGRVTYLCNIGLICNRIWKVGLNHQTWPFAVLLLLMICYRLVVVVFWKDVTLLVQSLIHSILFPALCPIFLLRNIFINSLQTLMLNCLKSFLQLQTDGHTDTQKLLTIVALWQKNSLFYTCRSSCWLQQERLQSSMLHVNVDMKNDQFIPWD